MVAFFTARIALPPSTPPFWLNEVANNCFNPIADLWNGYHVEIVDTGEGLDLIFKTRPAISHELWATAKKVFILIFLGPIGFFARLLTLYRADIRYVFTVFCSGMNIMFPPNWNEYQGIEYFKLLFENRNNSKFTNFTNAWRQREVLVDCAKNSRFHAPLFHHLNQVWNIHWEIITFSDNPLLADKEFINFVNQYEQVITNCGPQVYILPIYASKFDKINININPGRIRELCDFGDLLLKNAGLNAFVTENQLEFRKFMLSMSKIIPPVIELVENEDSSSNLRDFHANFYPQILTKLREAGLQHMIPTPEGWTHLSEVMKASNVVEVQPSLLERIRN